MEFGFFFVQISLKSFIITSSESVNANLSKWFCSITIIPVVFWSQSSCQILAINKNLYLGDQNLDHLKVGISQGCPKPYV